MTDLTVVSLFDGIGGFPLAFERAGARVVATVEIDQAAAAIGHRHFPTAQQFPDITEVSGDDLRAAGFVPERGVVTAGWPCQDLSVAGRRAGLDGARSGLWWQVARILADLRPTWFVGENVPGLLSSVCTPECEGGCMAVHGGAMGAVLGSLADIGYGIAYRVLDAQHFGVPQRRRRVFIVGHLGEPWTAPAQVLLEPEGGARDSAARREARTHATSSASHSAGTPSPVCVTGHTHTHTLTASAAKLASEDGAGRGVPIVTHIDTHTHTTDPCRRCKAAGVGTCGADDNQAQAGHVIAFSHTAGIDQQASTPTMKAGHDTMPAVHADSTVRRLTELECERLQGYPDGWTADQAASARYRQLGNSVAVPAVEWIAHRLVNTDKEIH